jgi:serine/threonine protein kinase
LDLFRVFINIFNKIGEGGFGSVYLCFNGKGNYSDLFAIKCIKSSKSIDSPDRERRFGYVSKLNSKYLVQYQEIFTFDNDLYVVMEYFENGSLNNFIKRHQKGNIRIKKYVCFYLI